LLDLVTMQTVLVTGASSGIGHATAKTLASHGFEVFAGVRKPSDAEKLRADHEHIRPVILDVGDRASVASAAERVERELAGRGLDGLVNNAGTGLAAPMEYVSLDEVRRQLEINVIGQLAVTQALLPLVRRAVGRIVNMGSVGAHIAIPFGGVLCAAKSALTSFNDALRLELRPFGIHVCLIEPASIATPAVDKTLGDAEAVIRALPDEGRARYGTMLRAFIKRAYEREKHGSPPEEVAEIVLHALTDERPRARYLAGKDARRLVALPWALPARVVDRIRLRLLGLPTKFGELAEGG
jgi:NAD(P)-dependent dehydrogenase (short-subunit alcohol dehydrogenase family)